MSAVPNSDKIYELEDAIASSNIDYIRIYLENGGDPNMGLFFEPSLLYSALEAFEFDIAILLLERGADPNMKFDSTSNGRSSYQTFRAGDEGGFTLLHTIPDKIREGNPPLAKKYLEVARILLDHGADPNIKDKYGNTVLFATAIPLMFPPTKNEIYTFIDMLLAHNADINARNKDGHSLIDLIMDSGYIGLKSIEYLLTKGANISIENVIQSLGFANVDIPLLFLNVIDPTIAKSYIDSAGNTLLHLALTNSKSSQADRKRVIQKLLELGVNPDQANQVGQTPARLATLVGLTNISNLLNVGPSRKNIYGFTNNTIRRLSTKGGRRRRLRRTRRSKSYRSRGRTAE